MFLGGSVLKLLAERSFSCLNRSCCVDDVDGSDKRPLSGLDNKLGLAPRALTMSAARCRTSEPEKANFSCNWIQQLKHPGVPSVLIKVRVLHQNESCPLAISFLQNSREDGARKKRESSFRLSLINNLGCEEKSQEGGL